MSSINITTTKVLLEVWLFGKPKLSLHAYVQTMENVFRIIGLSLTKIIGLLRKPKVNELGNKLGSVHMRYTHVKELIIY